MKRKALYVIGTILLLLIITNPSQTAFKEYLGEKSYAGIRRTNNYFIFSIYEFDDKYLAIAGNFFVIHKHEQPKTYANDDTTKTYSSAADTNIYVALSDDSVLNHYVNLYNNLLKAGYNTKNLGSFLEFKDKLEIDSNARKLYRNLVKDGYDIKQLGTEDQFVKTFVH